MPVDIDQLLDAAAAEPTRPPDVGALRARARRARRRERILTGGGALAVLALAITALTAGGDVVQLRPGDDAADPTTGASHFAITATVEPDAALVGVHVDVTDPGEVAAGETAQHDLTVTVADSPVNLTRLAHLDQTVRQPDGGALQVLGVCTDERAPACPDDAALVAAADTPRRIPLRLRTDDLTAGTYELAVSLSAAEDAAPAPPIHLTYTVTELTAPGGDGATPPPDPQRDDIVLVADPARVPPAGTVRLVIHNQRDEPLTYGLAYMLERWDGRAWAPMPTEGGKAIALAVEPGATSDPQEILAPTADGWYRITKTADVNETEEAVLYARFEVRAALLQPEPGEDFVVLAAAAATHTAGSGHVALDPDGLAEAWGAVEAVTAPPSIPAGFGVLVVTVGSSTCRSTADVLGVEVDDDRAVVVVDADGEFAQPCPGPPGAPRGTAYAVAVPAEVAGTLTAVETRVDQPPRDPSPPPSQPAPQTDPQPQPQAEPEPEPQPDPQPDPQPLPGPQRFSMYVHCGVEAAQIDGRWWEVIEPLYRDDQPGLGPPAGWSDPYQDGVLTRLGPELAEFRADHGAVVQLRPRDVDEPPRICQ